MQITREQVMRDDGLMEEIKRTIVGKESPALRKAFETQRKALEDRLRSGETISATVAEHRRIGRNDPCPCGSKEKFKKCCGSRLPDDDPRIKD